MNKKTEGIRIDHNYDELESGTSYIMVAKDTPLIDASKETLLEQATELENIDLQASHKQKIKLYNKDQVKRVRASGFNLKQGNFYDPTRNALEGDGINQFDPNDTKKVTGGKYNLI